jgi:NADH:ubiquinone oxidoreductase subunit 6 (subunit J)
MTHVPHVPHVSRYVPAKTNQGWPVVGLIALLAFALIAMVVVIHQRTYKPPTDPTWHAVGGQANPTKGTGH